MKIKRIEAERKKNKKVQLTEMDIEQQEKDERIRKLAISKADEDCPEARAMDGIILRAKCATIRDEQLKIKAQLKEQEKLEEEKWHKSMMAEREAALAKEKTKFAKIQETNRKEARILQMQIQEREHQKLLEREQAAKEGEEMLRKIQELKEEANRKMEEKEQTRKRMAEEMIEANKRAAELKHQRALAQAEEDKKIAEYMKAKTDREAEIERQKEAEHAARELKAAKLRAKQKRAMDNRGAMDELRARRAQEAKDRKWRQEQLQKAKRAKELQEDIKRTRENQLKFKQARMLLEIQDQKAGYAKMVKELKEVEDRRKQKQEAQAKLQKSYCQDLLVQIKEREDQIQKEKLENNRVSNQNNLERMEKLKKMKMTRLARMEAEGISKKHRAELERYKI